MSRIAGFCDLSCDRQRLNRMLMTMGARCGAERIIYEYEACTLMCFGEDALINGSDNSLNWGEECFRIILDGELYNKPEIIQELKILGHKFDNESDTETILHAYAQWGERTPEKIFGAFSFAIWHEYAKKLFVARDQMGVKPLFYALHDQGFLFASEIKTVLSYPGFSARIDRDSVAQILLIGPGRVPGSGVFKGIYELEPGHYGLYSDNKFKNYKYWSLTDREHTKSFQETADEVRTLVLDSIGRQLKSSLRIGAFLSGGLDSGIISAVCGQKMGAQGRKLDTFSVDYEDNDINFVAGTFQPERDNAYIDIMCAHIGSNHHWTVLSPQDLIKCLEAATCARDLPGMGDVDFSLMAFCRQIKKNVDVALSGECADEIFGGYPWFKSPTICPELGFPWSENLNYRAAFMNSHYSVDAKEFVADHIQTSLNKCDIIPACNHQERLIKQMTWLNQYWFMQTLIDRNDRMSCNSRLKIRAPFCDPRIAQYMYAVPWKYKHYEGREKGLLRYAMEGVVPSEILWRKKSPYPKTYDPAYTNLVREMLSVVINDCNAPIWDVVNINAVQRLMDEDFDKPWYGQLMKRPQTMAYILQIHVWLNKYNIILE